MFHNCCSSICGFACLPACVLRFLRCGCQDPHHQLSKQISVQFCLSALMYIVCTTYTTHVPTPIWCQADMEFVQNFTPPEFQVKNFTPPFSPNFNSFSKKKHKKLVKIEKFTPLGKNFTLPPALTALTNCTSGGFSLYWAEIQAQISVQLHQSSVLNISKTPYIMSE